MFDLIETKYMIEDMNKTDIFINKIINNENILHIKKVMTYLFNL